MANCHVQFFTSFLNANDQDVSLLNSENADSVGPSEYSMNGAAAEESTPTTDPALTSPELSEYTEDTFYSELINSLNSENYYIEEVKTVYVSREYIEKTLYNSRENIYFGYKLSELKNKFQEQCFVFTLGDNGGTVVRQFEGYDDTFDRIFRNTAIGTGVIVLCVTVALVALPAAPVVSVMFFSAAHGATIAGVSGAAMVGVTKGAVAAYQTKDPKLALKAAALGGSEAFRDGAIIGAVIGLGGGASKIVQLERATSDGLTLNQAARVQMSTKYPIDVIKNFRNPEQAAFCKEIGLKSRLINGRNSLVRDIDLKTIDSKGLSNLERMKRGLAPLDSNAQPYELHHLGQHSDSTLTILTREEHRLGDMKKFWHNDQISEINRPEFQKIKSEFWKEFARLLENGGLK